MTAPAGSTAPGRSSCAGRVLEQCVGKCCGPRHVVRRRRCRRRVGRSLGGPHRHSGYTAAHPGGFAARRRGMARDDRHPRPGGTGTAVVRHRGARPGCRRDAGRVRYTRRSRAAPLQGPSRGPASSVDGSSSAARAFVSVSVATVRLPGLNHLFQTARDGPAQRIQDGRGDHVAAGARPDPGLDPGGAPSCSAPGPRPGATSAAAAHAGRGPAGHPDHRRRDGAERRRGGRGRPVPLPFRQGLLLLAGPSRRALASVATSA